MATAAPQRFMLIPAEVYERLKRQADDSRKSKSDDNNSEADEANPQPVEKESPKPLKTTPDASPMFQQSTNPETPFNSDRDNAAVDWGPFEPHRLFTTFPVKCQARAFKLLLSLQKASLKWDAQGTIYDEEGAKIPDSNIAHVVRHLVSPLPGRHPPGEKYVRDFIKRMNISQKLLFKAKAKNCGLKADNASHTSKDAFRDSDIMMDDLHERGDKPLQIMPNLASGKDLEKGDSVVKATGKQGKWVSLR